MLKDIVRDALDPVRDLHVAAILEAMAAALSDDAEVEAEPWLRAVDGRLRRDGPLRLPSRADLRVIRGGRVVTRRIRTASLLDFTPFSGALDNRVALSVAPFDWGEVELRALRGPGGANWTPLRLWALEWMQSRFGEESADLACALHRLDGPYQSADGWRFTVDFGSAPVACFEAMLTAMGACGCAAFEVGESA